MVSHGKLRNSLDKGKSRMVRSRVGRARLLVCQLGPWGRLVTLVPMAIVVLALTLPTVGTAQQPPDTEQTPPQSPEESEAPTDQPSQPVFRSEINFVRVDAIVTDGDGNPVLDLTAEDFEVLEDDVAQEIESFELIEISGEPDPTLPPPSSIRNEYDQIREAARPDSRIFVFFLDDYHVRDLSAMRMTAPLAEFVETQLRPTDLVGVMYPLTPLFDVRLTRDHARVVRALQAFEGRKYDYSPRNMYEESYSYYPTTTVEIIRNDVSLSALRALSIHLGGLREGRKSIIVLSEGYSDYVPPQMQNQSAALGGIGRVGLNPDAGSSVMDQTMQFFENTARMTDLLHVADIANKNNTSFYTVDPRGLAVFEYDMSDPVIGAAADSRILRGLQDSLYLLADETDGRALINQNDVLPGLAQIVRDQSAYYLFGYTSSGSPTDGEFHEIKVHVKRPNVRVRARKGYYALTAENAARVLAPPKPDPPKAVEMALAVLAEPTRGRLVRTWIGARRGDGGKTKVTFVWEPVGSTQSQRRESASQLTLMAMSDSAAYFRGEVARHGAAGPRTEFDADPGTVEFNVAIEDEYGDVIDRTVREVVVPDFTGPDLALSTPTVIRAVNELEFRRILADSDALPTASRYYRRTDQLVVRVEAYAPGDALVMVTAQLLNREGTSMLEIQVEEALTDGLYQLTLGMAPFPRGDYLIEISAEVDEVVEKKFIAFRIQG